MVKKNKGLTVAIKTPNINRVAKKVEKKIEKKVSKKIKNKYSSTLGKRNNRIKATDMTIPKGMGSSLLFSSNKNRIAEHVRNLIDPWNARDAKLPNAYENYSRSSKIKTSFTLPISTPMSGTNGCLLIVIDPDYLTPTTSTTTTYYYNNNQNLNGSAITPTSWSTVPVGAQPQAPANSFTKARLVSAGLTVTVKQSELNLVGTVYACLAYENVTPALASGTLLGNATYDQYQNFQNIENGCGGIKRDIGKQGDSVCIIWKPVDPLSLTFLGLTGEINDTSGQEAGAFQKWVVGLSGFTPGTPVLVDVVLNWELMTQGQATAWYGGTSKDSVNLTEHQQALDFTKSYDQIFSKEHQMSNEHLFGKDQMEHINMSDIMGDSRFNASKYNDY